METDKAQLGAKENHVQFIDRVKRVYKDLEPFRRNRKEAIRAYAGDMYSAESDDDGVALAQRWFDELRGNVGSANNQIALMVDIYVRQLVARNPRAKITTVHNTLKPIARQLTSVVNDEIRRMDLAKALALLAKDAMFGIGIAKVGVSPVVNYEEETSLLPGNYVFVERVSFDDYIFDNTKTSWDRIEFEGNRFFLNRKAVENHPLLDKDIAKKLRRAAPQSDRQDHASNLSRTVDIDDDVIELVEIYEPRKGPNGRIRVYAWDNPGAGPLHERAWDGPPEGPFHRIMFGDVPDQLLPSAPATRMLALQRDLNAVHRKRIETIRNHKQVLMVRSQEVGQRIIDANHMDVVVGQNPGEAAVQSFNEPSPTLGQTAAELQALFSRQAGNLDVLGGLGTQANTVGQEELLTASSSQMISAMQSEMQRFVRSIVGAIAHAVFYDDDIDRPVVAELRAVGASPVVTRFHAGQDKGDFLQYNFDISPYSMNHTTPESELNQIRAVVANDIIPLFPMMQAQGVEFNVQEYFQIIQEATNVPLDRITGVTLDPRRLEQVVIDPSQRVRSNRPTAAPRSPLPQPIEEG